jgi:hypothetical protein
MTRTDVVASSRPQKAGAAPKRKGSSSAMRRLMVLPVAFALTMALVLPGAALAADEPLSGYTTTTTTTTTPTTTPTTTATTTPAPTTTATPTTGTSPSKEKSEPTKTTAPSTTATPTTEPAAKKASTLPFTGFDLRWTIGGGVLLIAMGFSLVVAQRRQRRSTGR